MLESDGVAMGNLTHVVVQFASVWWDDALFKWLSANKAGPDPPAGPSDRAAYLLQRREAALRLEAACTRGCPEAGCHGHG